MPNKRQKKGLFKIKVTLILSRVSNTLPTWPLWGHYISMNRGGFLNTSLSQQAGQRTAFWCPRSLVFNFILLTLSSPPGNINNCDPWLNGCRKLDLLWKLQQHPHGAFCVRLLAGQVLLAPKLSSLIQCKNNFLFQILKFQCQCL